MRALLQQQQKEQQAAHAAQSSLLERTRHQEHQHRAKVMRLRWTKAYTQLRQREKTLSCEIKQLLSSELYSRVHKAVTEDIFLAIHAEPEGFNFFLNDAPSEEALVARVGGPFPQDRGSHPTTETPTTAEGGGAWSSQAAPSVPGDEEAQRPINNSPLVSTARSPSAALRHPEGSLDGPLTLLRLAKKVLQVVSDKFGICSDFEAPKPQAICKKITPDAIPFPVLPELVRSHQTCQVAGLIFQWVRGLLQEKGSLLEQACAAAGAEVSAALAGLQGECDFLQQRSAFRLCKHRKLDYHGSSPSLTDTEDAVLRGEAPQVREAAAAASQLTLASKLHSLKTAQLQRLLSAQPSSLRQCRALNERELPAFPNKALGTQKNFTVSRGREEAVQFLWEAALKEYSKRLVHLEESHTQQLGKYLAEICLQKKRLREAVAQMLAQPVPCQNSSSAMFAEGRLGLTPLQEHTCSIHQSSSGTNFLARQEKGVESTMRSESQSESSSFTPRFTGASSLCEYEQAAASVTPFKSDAQGAGETMTTEECQDSIDVALLTVRWLAASHSVDQGGAEETESLPQRLQLAFPLADSQGIKRVVDAQQRLSSTRQKELTCKRVWRRGREAALADVLRTLEDISTTQRELAEGHRALAALKDRQGLLQKRLQLQRIKAEKQNRILAAARREEEEVQQKRKLQKAEEERGRREKEKVRLSLFRQKKVAEAQQEQERIKQEEEAAKEPAHLKLLKAARVARRQEQHNLRVFEQQLERQERQLQEQVLRQRLMVAASKLKPSAVRSPLRLLQQTAASQSQADAGAEQRHFQQKQPHYRLSGFEVQHSYSCAQLMQDIRFRLSAALAEKELFGSKAAQELLLSMSGHTDKKHHDVFRELQVKKI